MIIIPETARKASWTQAGVEAIHWKLAHVDSHCKRHGRLHTATHTALETSACRLRLTCEWYKSENDSQVRIEWYKSNKRRDTGSKTRSQEASWAVIALKVLRSFL